MNTSFGSGAISFDRWLRFRRFFASRSCVADRLTVTEYARILDTVFDDMKTWRAETIARTEMVGAYNGASRIAAIESEVVTAREWLTAGDGRVRDSHVALNGARTVSMDDAYPNGLMFPGDPNGDPAESINCRCVELYVTPITPEGTPR